MNRKHIKERVVLIQALKLLEIHVDEEMMREAMNAHFGVQEQPEPESETERNVLGGCISEPLDM